MSDDKIENRPPNDADPTPFLKAAVEALAAGEDQKALEAASEACWRAPELPAAHYAYGQAWLALGDPVRAEQAFGAAVRLKPDWADAWINYGLARYRQGFVEDAKTAMRQALDRAPGHPVATANLGAFMRISGESEGAEALLRQTIAREPDNAGARLNLAADLLQEERPADALALLSEAEPPADDLHAARHWRLQTSLALLQLSRFAEARAELDALEAFGPIPPELAPLWRWRRTLLAMGERDWLGAGVEAERMEAALAAMGPDAVPEHQIMARFDLAKFWSSRNDHPRAFRQWTEGHALLSLSQPFSREAHAAFIDANIATFTGARFAQGPQAANRDPAPVFIVGMPRSGTTLCEQILAAHRDAHGAGERGDLGRAFAVIGGAREDPASGARIAALPAEALDRAAGQYLAALHALAPDKTRIVDKMPGNYLYLGLAALMLPGARIIHCQRDPRDIGLSIFTFRFHGLHAYAHDLADLGWAIAEQIRLMDHWKAALPGRIVTVKLSDWVEDFDATLDRVLTHLDLPPDPNCARFHEAESRVRTVSRSQVRQPVNARGLGRWRTYEKELAPLIAELDAAGALEGWDG
jgi:Flp pilus assembly protein TadD